MKKKISRSVALKLTTTVLAVVLIGTAITVGVSRYISAEMLTKEILSGTQNETVSQAYIIDNWLSSQMAGVEMLAHVITVHEDMTSDELLEIFTAYVDQREYYLDVYMGFPDATMISGDGWEPDLSVWRAYERPWYQLALANPGEVVVTTPYVDSATNSLVITVSRTIYHGDRLKGVLAADIFIDELQAVVGAITLNDTGYAILLGADGSIYAHPGGYRPTVGGDGLTKFTNIREINGGAYATIWDEISGRQSGIVFNAGGSEYLAFHAVYSTGWQLVAVLPQSVITAPNFRVTAIVAPIALVAMLIVAIIINQFIKRTVVKPLTLMAAFLGKAAKTGDLSLQPQDIETIGTFAKSEDELGRCIESTAAFVGRVTEVAKVLESVSNNDLTTQIELLSDKDSMGISLKRMLANLNEMFAGINAASEQVATGSHQIADSAQALADGTSQQAATVEELSAAISQASQKTKGSAENARRAATLAEAIKDSAQKGSAQMDDMTQSVREISKASQDIGKIIKVIDDIAFQTNILALNAAVEAARAGQHGKGFAVVADEVRNLAAKSADAAKDTSGLITNSIEKAALGSRLADQTAESLAEIVKGIDDSSQIVGEIAESSGEQSREIADLNHSIENLTQVIQQNSASSEENAATADQLSGQSRVLQELVSRFKLSQTSQSGSSAKRSASGFALSGD